MNGFFRIFFASCLISGLLFGNEDSELFDPIYQGNISYLYDQSEMVGASPKALEAEFERRKSRLHSNDAWQKSAYLVVAACVGIPTYIALKPKFAALMNIGAGAAIGGTAFMIGVLGNVISSVTQAVFNYVSDTGSIWSKVWFPGEADALHKHELSYVRKKQQMPLNFHNLIEKKIIEVRSKRGQEMYGYSSSRKTQADPLSVIASALALPLASKLLTLNTTELENQLTGYSKEGVATMKRFALRHFIADKGSVFKKSFVYFYGKPGTGKTRAAKIIGVALNAPVVTISVKDINHLSDIYGDASAPGFLARALIKANALGTGGKNVLIVLNDVDRLFNRKETDESVKLLVSFLDLIEPETKSYYDNLFETEIDISQINGIFTGNTEFVDAALASRVQTVNFSNIGAKYKHFVAHEEIIPAALERFKKSGMPIELDKNDEKNIQLLIDEDRDPGFRNITFQVEEYLSGKVLDAILRQSTDSTSN